MCHQVKITVLVSSLKDEGSARLRARCRLQLSPLAATVTSEHLPAKGPGWQRRGRRRPRSPHGESRAPGSPHHLSDRPTPGPDVQQSKKVLPDQHVTTPGHTGSFGLPRAPASSLARPPRTAPSTAPDPEAGSRLDGGGGEPHKAAELDPESVQKD